MFGVSFGELLLISLIALLVLGPERLPGAARTAGLWIGRLKRSFNAIKQDVERELGAVVRVELREMRAVGRRIGSIRIDHQQDVGELRAHGLDRGVGNGTVGGQHHQRLGTLG